MNKTSITGAEHKQVGLALVQTTADHVTFILDQDAGHVFLEGKFNLHQSFTFWEGFY